MFLTSAKFQFKHCFFFLAVNNYNNNCLAQYFTGKIALGHRNALASYGRYLDLGQYFPVKNGPNSYYCINSPLLVPTGKHGNCRGHNRS